MTSTPTFQNPCIFLRAFTDGPTETHNHNSTTPPVPCQCHREQSASTADVPSVVDAHADHQQASSTTNSVEVLASEDMTGNGNCSPNDT